MMAWKYLVAVLPLLIGRSIQEQQDPLQSFCRRWGQQTGVVDRRLYIDGGFVNYNTIDSNHKNDSNTALLYADLDTVDPNLGMPEEYANLSKPTKVPDVNGGILWVDTVSKLLYLYGGEVNEGDPDPFDLWMYDTVSGKWSIVDTDAHEQSIQRASHGAGAVVRDGAFAYYYGGWLSNASVPDWGSRPRLALSTMLMYNFDEQKWTNSSGPDKVGRALGSMVYLPASDRGLLVYFGGLQFPGEGTSRAQPMDEILLYDIANSKWYTQRATGDVPENRRKFCAGATWAPDYSSYNIYLYGGLNVGEGVGFDDVYILSLPSFKWIKWFPTTPGAGYPHHSLTCDVIDGAQMIVMGGTFPNSTQCDVPNVYAMHNLDLGKQNPDGAPWYMFRPNITSYRVPPEIISAVGGSATGKANVTAPADGFDNRDFINYFQRVYTPAPRVSRLPSTVSSSSTPIAAIAGGTVGGVVGALALAGLLYFCVRTRRQKKKTKRNTLSGDPAVAPSPDAEEGSAPKHQPGLYELSAKQSHVGELANTAAPVEMASPSRANTAAARAGDDAVPRRAPTTSPSVELPA